jgi:hypothetical protein
MLLVDSHGATHPTPEPRVPGPVGSREEQHALADPESAAQALGGAELD